MEKIIFPLNEKLKSISHLHVLFKNGTKTLRAIFGIAHDGGRAVFLRKNNLNKSVKVTAKILSEIDRVFRKNEVPALFVLLPAKEQIETDWSYRYYGLLGINKEQIDFEGPNKLLREILESKNIRVVDLPPYFKKIYNDRGIKLHGDIDSHFNRQGHEYAAKFLRNPVSALLSK